MSDGDWDDDDLDDDYPEDDDSSELVACPHCGEEIYEEAEQCPHCGEYVIHDTRVLASKPLWYVLLALAGIAAVILLLSGLAGL